MSSWFSVPLPNPFKSLHFSDDDDDDQNPDQNDAVPPTAGVRDDLSAIGETIGRQLRGVAAFLSPPPQPSTAATEEPSGTSDEEASRTFEGIRIDLEEIKGSFRSSLSLLSGAGISKLASNFLQLNDEGNERDDDRDDDDDDGDHGDEVAGITDEVIEFVSKIADRPELWTDFPLPLDQEFDLSDPQFEHASTIGQLVPSLADLRSKLSSVLGDKQFWMIYFILLLPRLNDGDVELLSTPEIVEARETLLQMLQLKKSSEINSEIPQTDDSPVLQSEATDVGMERSESADSESKSENASRSIESDESDKTRQLTVDDGKRFTSSKATVADNSNAAALNKEHKNVDDSLGEEHVTAGTSAAVPKQFQREDDVSFSDLEDDDKDLPDRRHGSGAAVSTRGSSPEGSSEWVRLNKDAEAKGVLPTGQSSLKDRDSEGEDWLTVVDFDPY